MPRQPARPVLRPAWLVLHAAWLLCWVPAAQAQAAATPAAAPSQAAGCATCHGATGNPSLPGLPVLAGQTARYIALQLRDFQEGRRHHSQQATGLQGLTAAELRLLATWYSAQTAQPLRSTSPPDANQARLGKAKADDALCTTCHLSGFTGQNEIPRVAGQPMDYVLQQLRDFKSGARHNDGGNMSAVTRLLSDTDLQQIAQHIAGL